MAVSATDRTARVVRGLGGAFLARGLSLATPLILIPVTYRSFGVERYGVWATIVGTTSMFLWADLGLGNGLLTKLSAELALGNLSRSKALISSAYSMLTVFAVALIALTIASPLAIPWARVFGASSDAQVDPTFVICFSLLFANVPWSLIQRVQYAAQEVALSNLLQMVGPAFSLASVVTAVALGAPYLTVVILMALGPLVSSMVASALFYRRRPELRPRIVSPWDPTGRGLISLGLGFVAIQVCSSVYMNSDNLIAAHVVGAASLGNFSVTLRIFLLLGGLVTLATSPLWPANAEALARGDTDWVSNMTRRMSLIGGGVIAVAGAVIMAAGPIVLPRLLGGRFESEIVLMIGVTGSWTIVALTSPFMMVQNSVGLLWPQMIAWPALLLTAVPLKIYVAASVGARWIPSVGAISYMLIVTPAALYGYNVVIRQRKEGSDRATSRAS